MRFRHYFLLLALVILLVLFFYCIIRKINHTPIGYICVILSLGLALCTGWLLLFPKLTPIPATGKYNVSTIDCWYTDPVRIETYTNDGSHRELAVTFWYPEDYKGAGTCSLVVFSHGTFGVKSSNETLYRELASHGYIVCAMDHTYQCFTTRNSKGEKINIDSKFFREAMRIDAEKKPEEALLLQKKWMDIRMGDINLVLDTVLEKAESANDELPVYRLINTNKIALIGHSLGGSGVLGIGRVRDDISVVIALESPFMYDVQRIEDGKFVFDQAPYPVPVLNIYSDQAWKPMREWQQYSQNVAFLESDQQNVENMHISGCNHMGLTDFSLSSPFLSDIMGGSIAKNKPHETLKLINEVCLEFLDKYV